MAEAVQEEQHPGKLPEVPEGSQEGDSLEVSSFGSSPGSPLAVGRPSPFDQTTAEPPPPKPETPALHLDLRHLRIRKPAAGLPDGARSERGSRPRMVAPAGRRQRVCLPRVSSPTPGVWRIKLQHPAAGDGPTGGVLECETMRHLLRPMYDTAAQAWPAPQHRLVPLDGSDACIAQVPALLIPPCWLAAGDSSPVHAWVPCPGPAVPCRPSPFVKDCYFGGGFVSDDDRVSLQSLLFACPASRGAQVHGLGGSGGGMPHPLSRTLSTPRSSVDTNQDAYLDMEVPRFALRAGPRRTIYYQPASTRMAIVCSGGICPGENDVVRALVLKASGCWPRVGEQPRGSASWLAGCGLRG